jgi:hypothetical protein
MTLFHLFKRLVLVTSAVFALLAVVSCGEAPPVATVAPTPAIVAPVATEVPQAIQELAAPEAQPAVEVAQPAVTSDESAPCAAGQLKGNETSHIFHAPGQLAYARTHAHVTCFDTAAQATAAGYRAAKR